MDLGTLARSVGADAVLTASDELDARGRDLWAVEAKRLLHGGDPHRPAAVVLVSTEDQVSAALRWANETATPATPRGLGSGVTGAAVPLHGGIVLDLSGLAGIVELDEEDLTVTVRAGTRGSDLEDELAAAGYTLGHSPQSLELSSVGGWLATRATGQFSSRYGGIEDLVLGLTAVLPTGESAHLPATPRPSVGPDLTGLLIGAEGTLGVVTRATLRIFPRPEHRTLQALRFPDVRAGVAAMRAITRTGMRPFLVRCYDQAEAPLATGIPDFEGCALFLGSEGPRTVAEAEQSRAVELATDHGGAPLGDGPVREWMRRRFDYAALEAVLRTPGGVAETIEVAHFWSGILDLYTELTEALAPLATVLAHFSHVYPHGTSLYLIVLGEQPDDAAAEARIREIWDTAMRVCLARGAPIAHHHGVGLARLPYVRDALGDASPVLARVKAALDPGNVLNPGKLGLPG